MVLVLHNLMLIVIDDVKSMEHAVISLYEYLITILVEIQLIYLCLEHDHLQLCQIVKIEECWKEDHRVGPPELAPQSEVSHGCGR
jgi:hypothetical protein